MKTCSSCGTTETCRWYGGPTCNTCHGRAFRKANPNYHQQFQQNQALDPKIKEKRKRRSQQRYKLEKPAIIKARREYQNQRLQTDVLFKLKRNLRARLNKAVQFGYKAGSAVDDLGCSIEELKKHLENKFKLGMSWSNYGEWHIDHIIPLASFNLSDFEQVKVACNYINLQPLWAEENLKKGDK